jgi:hypothetical protein
MSCLSEDLSSLGRRLCEGIAVLVGRHAGEAVRQHLAQLEKNCCRGDLDGRRKQRQALLHGAYDARRS